MCRYLVKYVGDSKFYQNSRNEELVEILKSNEKEVIVSNDGSRNRHVATRKKKKSQIY